MNATPISCHRAHRRRANRGALTILLYLLASAPVLTFTADAEQATAGAQSADVFTPAVLRRRLQSSFLEDDHRAGLDGWVELVLMVDAAGSPYEIVVEKSSGNGKLDSAALRWMKEQVFKPAQMNGVAVDARHGYRLSKSDIPSTGTSNTFSHQYKQVHEAIERGDQAAADAAQQALRARTLEEQRAGNFVRYEYLVRWGTKQQQLDALKAWIAHSSSFDVRPVFSDSFKPVWPGLFQLQVDAGDYGGALQTYDRIDPEAKLNPAIATVRARLVELAADQRSYSVDGEVTTRGSWFLRLLKRRLSVDVLDGEVTELKVRCERKFVKIAYQASVQFTITPGYGTCDLEVLGKPGTKFKLTQS